MTEQQRVDIGLMYLYNNNGVPVHDLTLPQFENVAGLELLRVLNTIYEIGFANRRENVQRTLGSNGPVYDYWINSKGIHFIDTLPVEFSNKPYSYYQRIEADETTLKKERELLDDKVKKITIGNISLNKYAPLLSLFVAALAIAVPVAIKIMSKDTVIKTESTLPQLERVIQQQDTEIKILQENLDSLKKILKYVSK